ncbi:MAG: hypothetical protein AABX73_02515 [Nanoarchaeota archaeon]
MLIHLANSKILPKSRRLATRDDLEKAITFDEEGTFLSGNYVEFGIALLTAGDSHIPNNELAKKLAEQLDARDIALEDGVLIPISALTNKDDENESYGLTLELNDNATKETIRYLREFKWHKTRNEGLACAEINGRLWSYNNKYIADSNENGRVVVINTTHIIDKIDIHIKKSI